MKIKIMTLGLSIFLISACNQKGGKSALQTTDSVQVDPNREQKDTLLGSEKLISDANADDAAGEWLRRIFKTKHSSKYFPDYNVEEQLCTKRYQAFIYDSGEIYGPSNLTDEEYPAAEKEYKAKWAKIYPLEEREMWLFGRGNGDMGELKQLEISKIKDGLYRVFIDYGNDMKTENKVTIVKEDGAYKIDYCDTKFID